jgi:aminoglycoside phosphotransferase (APT) family kinase protein
VSEDSVSAIRQASLDLRDAMPAANIVRFLRHATDVRDVQVSDLELPAATGVSSGAVFFTAEIGDAPAERLFLKFDTGAAVRPFHQYDLQQQFDVQKVLFDAGVPTPEPLFVDPTGDYLGKPGQMMKIVRGNTGSSKAWVEGALASASRPDRQSMLVDAVRQMARMHTVDISDPRLASLFTRAAGDTSLEREINWSLDLARSHDFSDVRVDAAADALRQAIPRSYHDAFSHGDNKFDNYIFDAGKVSAVVWKSSTIAIVFARGEKRAAGIASAACRSSTPKGSPPRSSSPAQARR